MTVSCFSLRFVHMLANTLATMLATTDHTGLGYDIILSRMSIIWLPISPSQSQNNGTSFPHLGMSKWLGGGEFLFGSHIWARSAVWLIFIVPRFHLLFLPFQSL